MPATKGDLELVKGDLQALKGDMRLLESDLGGRIKDVRVEMANVGRDLAGNR